MAKIGIAKPIADRRVYLPVFLISCPASIDPIANPILLGNRCAPAVADDESNTEVK